VNDSSFQLAPAESLALVGEWGSGKTMLALALMGLVPPGARISGRAVRTTGGAARSDVAQLNETAWRAVRGREIAMVFQEPMTSLNPVMRIGAQMAEAMRAHETGFADQEVRKCILEALRRASVPGPEVRAEQFPHQLSGGMRRRAGLPER
jgi:ABC-type dipeptide/oligopeptide/nickel transport system ATPase component